MNDIEANPPLLVRRRSGVVEALSSRSTMMGIDSTADIGETVTTLASGDTALLYSDGLHSLKAKGGERFTGQSIAEAFAGMDGSADLLPRLIAELVQRSDAQTFEDDLAAIALRRG